MRRTYFIGPLLKPFRLIFLLMISVAMSAILFSLGNGIGAALGIYLYGVGGLFLLTALLALSARYAVELDLNSGSFTDYVQIFGFRIGAKTTVPEQLDYVLLSTVSYTDNNTPLQAGDTYYVVYLVYNGMRKQAFLESTYKAGALRLASELAQRLQLEFRDNTGARDLKA